jgi:diguanylate cyclase
MERAMMPAGLTAEFLLGAAVGVALLGAAVAAGFWLGRHFAMRIGAPPHDADQLMDKWMRLMHWSRGLADEMSQYGSVMSGVSRLFSVSDQNLDAQQRSVAIDLLARVVKANEKLQKRLNQAETMLQDQADEIAAHMSEARTDPLTGLPNRRAFDEGLARLVAEWKRHGTPFSVLALDIDHFKRFNDSFGHQVGDEVLVKVAKELARIMRESDLVTRVGGEELAVVLPNSELPEARQAAERARRAMETMPLTADRGSRQVTISVGVAQCGRGENGQQLVHRADEALYAAKHAGRNRVFWHDGERCRPHRSGESGSPMRAPATSLDVGDDVARDFRQVCDDLRRRLDEVVTDRVVR